MHPKWIVLVAGVHHLVWKIVAGLGLAVLATADAHLTWCALPFVIAGWFRKLWVEKYLLCIY